MKRMDLCRNQEETNGNCNLVMFDHLKPNLCGKVPIRGHGHFICIRQLHWIPTDWLPETQNQKMNLDKHHNFSEKGGRYCEVKEIQNARFAKLLDEKDGDLVAFTSTFEVIRQEPQVSVASEMKVLPLVIVRG